MRNAIEPLEPELRALLDREKAAASPDAALERIRSRLTDSVSGSPSRSRTTDDRSPALSAAARAWIVTALGVGGVLGAGLHALLRPPAERVVYVERPAPPPVEPAVPSSAPQAPTSAASITAPPPALSLPRRPATPVAPAASSLLAEREMLDRARDALAQDDGARALAVLEQHAQTFPRPRLAEEREALAVQALVIAGRYAEARARGARFRMKWPSSLFLPAVDASLGSIP